MILTVFPAVYVVDKENPNSYVEDCPTIMLFREATEGKVRVETVVMGLFGNTTLPKF